MNFTFSQLDDAYQWRRLQRKHFPPDADIWHFRHCYSAARAELLEKINAGVYRLSAQQKIIKTNGETIHLWGSQDVLVMKLIANKLTSLCRYRPAVRTSKGMAT
ncbi:MAG: hypothetical protein GY896_22565 [Gammaproteobacteria bacterium]|nr:hypothetical protein [Gammaproteobacteria bacterium]